MPLFQVSDVQIDGGGRSKRELIEKQPVQFAGEDVLERRDLQPLLRDKPEAIDSNLMIISEEFSDWEESHRRIDLLGLDRQGKLVVIELKRVEDGGHMELQALRYAAMVSSMNFEQIVGTYERFLICQGKAGEQARKEILDFLNAQDPDISTKPRVVLVAPTFSKEITTAVMWLNNQGLDIRCVKANLYKLNGHLYLNIEQVIPLPSASDYIIKIREKQKAEERSKAELLHLEFWTQFRQYLEDCGSSIRMGRPSSTAMGNVTLGQSSFRLIPWNVLSNSSGLWVQFTGAYANTMYEKIAQGYRDQVADKLSPLGELVWRPSDSKGSVLSLRRPSTLSNRETWQELNEWMAQVLETTYELFSKIVTNLNADGFFRDGASNADIELPGEPRGDK